MSRTDLRVAQSAIRCPYCHGEVNVAQRDWVVCGVCLARHHDACWSERSACSACGATERLVSSPKDDAKNDVTAELEQLRVQTALATLEREWDREQRRLLSQPAVREPTDPAGQGLATGCVMSGGGAILLAVGIGNDAVAPVAVGMLVILVGFVMGMSLYGRERAYAEARARFDRQRAALRDELEALPRRRG